MNDLTRARLLLAMPRRDWRFWGALSCCFGALATLIAVISVVNVNGDLSGRLTFGDGVGACRARAATFSATQTEIRDSLLAEGFVALSRGSDLAPYEAALTIASENSRKALQARDDATQQCTDDPSFDIDPSILAPVPFPPKEPTP